MELCVREKLFVKPSLSLTQGGISREFATWPGFVSLLISKGVVSPERGGPVISLKSMKLEIAVRS